MSKLLLLASCISLLISLYYGMLPGHSYQSRFVDDNGNIDREAVLDGVKYEQMRDLGDVGMQFKWLYNSHSAINNSSVYLFLSWTLLACSYGLHSRKTKPINVDSTEITSATFSGSNVEEKQ